MSEALRDLFRSSLNPDHLRFMDEIEAQSGVRIDVEHLEPGDTAAMGMRCYAGAIRIEIPSSNAIHPPAAFHELQHLDRYLVQGVPAMGCMDRPTDPDDRLRIGLLDNPVEHLVIVPQAAERNMRDEAFWNDRVRKGWLEIDNSGPDYLYDRQQYVLLNWLQTYLATDSAVIAFAEGVLAAEGTAIETVTRAVREEALENLDDKVELTRIVTAGLNIPSRRVQLQTFDKATGSFTYRPL